MRAGGQTNPDFSSRGEREGEGKRHLPQKEKPVTVNTRLPERFTTFLVFFFASLESPPEPDRYRRCVRFSLRL